MSYYCPPAPKPADDCAKKEKNYDGFKRAGAVLGAMGCGGVLVYLTTRHRPYILASASILAIGPIGYGLWGSNSEREQQVVATSKGSCTTIFDLFRFVSPPGCYEKPRETPLVFYNDEPAKPIVEKPWTESFAYDNVPKHDCKKKKEQIVAAKETQMLEAYGNLPPAGQCPKK